MMRRLICLRWLKPVLFGAALLFFAFGCDSLSSSLKGSSAPAIQADIFYPSGQARFNLSQVNSERPVLIVFWATWCEACREEIPALNQLAKQYTGKLETIAVNAQEEPNTVKNFLSENPLNYSVILDESGEISDLFDVTAIPSVLLLAKGGEILYYGFRLPGPEKLEAALSV